MKGEIRGSFWLWVSFVTWVVLAGTAPAGAEVREANAGRGGETLDLNSLAAPGRITMVEFYSPYCPPCLSLAPLLEQLAARRSDLSIRKVNINRPEIKGIDWKSPLVRQYSIRSVPYFVIFDPKGKVAAHGKAATRQLEDWLTEARLLNMGEKGKK
ncbi:MAG: thioredoxin family protein [Deltaproteobacteria bacterium]|nr:thioredoxin family protein [Deltaproteobacteria bacterium]